MQAPTQTHVDAQERAQETLNEKQAAQIRAVADAIQAGAGLGRLMGQKAADYERYEQQAYKFYMAGKHEEAMVMVRGIQALDPTRPYPYLIAGDIALKRNEVAEATEAFTRARSLAPESPTIALKLAECHLRAGATGDAEEALRAVLGMGLEQSNPRLRRARALVAMMQR